MFVGDIVIALRDGGTVAEDWSSPYAGWSAFAAALGAFFGIGLLVGAATRRRRPDRPFLFVPTAVAVPVTLFVAALCALDALVLSRTNPLRIDYRGYENRVETAQQVVERTRGDSSLADGARRVVCLGSSQTWGSGATTSADTWVRRLERILNADAPARPWHCFNGGINAGFAQQIFDVYRREWARPEAELVLVNLSHNDGDRDAFRRALQDLVAFHRERGVRTVFLLEPDSIESVSHNLAPNHAIMREVGAATGTPVIDMMERMSADPDVGFMWWDGVHMTSFGQRRFAELLHTELVALGLVGA